MQPYRNVGPPLLPMGRGPRCGAGLGVLRWRPPGEVNDGRTGPSARGMSRDCLTKSHERGSIGADLHPDDATRSAQRARRAGPPGDRRADRRGRDRSSLSPWSRRRATPSRSRARRTRRRCPTRTPPGEPTTLTVAPGSTPARRSAAMSAASFWIGSPIRATVTRVELVADHLVEGGEARQVGVGGRRGRARRGPGSGCRTARRRVVEHLEEAALDALAHHVLPAARLGVHVLPVEPDDVDEQALGEAVLAHDARRPSRGRRRSARGGGRPRPTSRPSRSMRATVCDTVGPDWPSRSAMRARSGTMPSSSSSKIVRRYISVVSMRSLTAGCVLCWWCPVQVDSRPILVLLPGEVGSVRPSPNPESRWSRPDGCARPPPRA